MQTTAEKALRSGAHALLACATAACSDATVPTARAWPAGTVLALNDDAILESEVDAIGSLVARVEPQDALPQLRRVALTNVILARCAARHVAGEERAQAWTLAHEFKAALDAGTQPPAALAGPAIETLQGGFGAMGLEVWSWALDAEPGRWSDPIEVVGGWRLARVDQRSAGAIPTDVRLAVSSYFFAYVRGGDPRQQIEAELDRSKLVFVDPRWRDVVPTLWQHRLHGTAP